MQRGGNNNSQNKNNAQQTGGNPFHMSGNDNDQTVEVKQTSVEKPVVISKSVCGYRFGILFMCSETEHIIVPEVGQFSFFEAMLDDGGFKLFRRYPHVHRRTER